MIDCLYSSGFGRWPLAILLQIESLHLLAQRTSSAVRILLWGGGGGGGIKISFASRENSLATLQGESGCVFFPVTVVVRIRCQETSYSTGICKFLTDLSETGTEPSKRLIILRRKAAHEL